MEFLSGLSEFIEVNSADLEIEKYNSAFNLLVDNKTGADDPKTKPHLKRSREHFQNLLSDLDTIIVQLDNIKQAAESYAKKKDPAQIQAVNKALQKIQTTFENNVYRYGMFGSYWDNPLYDFRVWAGENMDQGEWMPLGYKDTKSDGPDKIYTLFQQLQKMDISKPKNTWSPVYEEFYALIIFEKVKINSYLRRLNYFEKFNKILDQGASYYALKSKIFDIHTMTMQKRMISAAVQYMSLSIELLEEIKTTAQENLKALPDQNATTALAFHTEQLIDEVNRLASHGHFNGMSLLTGRFAKSNGMALASMPILLGSDISQVARMYIPTLTSYTLVAPDNIANPWTWDVYEAYTSEQDTSQFINRLDNSINIIQKSIKELEQLSAKLPEQDPYSKLQFDSLSGEKIQNIVKTYPLSRYKLDYNPQPEHSINTQSTLVLLILKYAHEQITAKLIKMRELAVQACNSVYNDEERMEFNKQFASLIKDIEAISKETLFNGEKLLHTDSDLYSDRNIKLSLVFDESGDIQKELQLSPLDPETLGLRESKYYLEIKSPNEGNRAIGMLDYALAIVNYNKARINSCLQSVVIGVYKDSIMQDYTHLLSSAKTGKNIAGKYIEYLDKLIKFIKQVCIKTKSYAWMAVSGVYTYGDRRHLEQNFSNLLEDTHTLLVQAQELLDELPQDVVLSKQEKSKISALSGYITKVRTETAQFKEEIKGKEFLQTGSNARSVFEKTAWILSIKE